MTNHDTGGLTCQICGAKGHHSRLYPAAIIRPTILKAELEIRQLHEKMDHLLRYQWERLVEIRQVQLEILNEMRGNETKADDSEFHTIG